MEIFIKKYLTRAFFLLALAANHDCYKLFFYWLHETAACCNFGVDLGNGLDHNSLSRSADGNPYSSSDLLYFTLFLPFTWTNYSKSNSLSLFCLLDKKFLGPKFSSLFLLEKKISKSKFLFSLPFRQKNF